MIDFNALKKLSSNIENWLWELLEKNKIGWPAITESDEIGIWTSAEILRILLSFSNPSLTKIRPVIENIIDSQLSSGGWTIIRGDVPSSVGTADALMALLKAKEKFATYPIANDIDDAIERGIKWVMLSQNTDGGWGLEVSKSTEGESRSYCTSYSLLCLYQLNKQEFQQIISNGILFLNSCHLSNGLWKSTPNGLDSRNGLSALITYVLTNFKKDEWTNDKIENILNTITNDRISFLPSIPLEEEEIQRRDGEIRLHFVGYYWASKLALLKRISYTGLPALYKYFIRNTDCQYLYLECLYKQETLKPTTWFSAEMYELLNLMIETLEDDPSLLIKSLIKITDIRSTNFSYIPQLINVIDFKNGDLINNLLKQIFEQYNTIAFIEFCIEFENILKQYFPSYLISFRKEVKTYIYNIIDNIEDFNELNELIAQKTNRRSAILIDIRNLTNLISILNYLSVGNYKSSETCLNNHIDNDNESFIKPSIFIRLKMLTSCLIELRNEVGSPFLAMFLQRAVEHSLKLREELVAITSNSIVLDLLTNIENELKAYHDAIRESFEIVFYIDSTDLIQNTINTITLKIRSYGFPIKSVNIKITSVDSIEFTENETIASPSEFGEFQARFDVIPRVSTFINLNFEVILTAINGEKCIRFYSRRYTVQPSMDRELEEAWEPISYRYEYGPIVNDPNKFIGRKEIINELILKLISTNQPIALTGEWRIGKSSLMGVVAHILHNQHDFAVNEIDIQMIQPPSIINFSKSLLDSTILTLKNSKFLSAPSKLKKIITGIQKTLHSINSLSIPGGVSVSRHQENNVVLIIQQAINSFTYINSELEINKEKLLVTIDEINLISSFDHAESILNLMRGIIQKCKCIKFIVCAHDAFGTFRKYRIPFFNIFQKFPIVGFSKSEIIELINLSESKIIYDDNIINLLHSECGGNPYWLCVVLDFIIKRLNDKKSRNIVESDINWSIEKAIQNQGEIFVRAWEDAILEEDSDTSAQILSALSEEGGQAMLSKIQSRLIQSGKSNIQTRELIDRLCEKGYLIVDNGILKFSNKLFSKWIWYRKCVT